MVWPFRRPSGDSRESAFRLNARRGKTVTPLLWQPAETAVIICDLWNDHWCNSAAQRCSKLAPRVNEFAQVVRARGGLVVHAPSDTMAFYSELHQRERARGIALVAPPMPIIMRPIDRSREPELPIDDSDGGCDDAPPSQLGQCAPWKHQHPAITIAHQDIISDVGEEIYSTFIRGGIKNIFMTGVHTNMCILARSFGIRQMVMLGFGVILVRNLTDSLYNPSMPPGVSHDRGTELVVEHIEKYWCPSISSGDVASPDLLANSASQRLP
jgi:nicotinamidase-related amidase